MGLFERQLREFIGLERRIKKNRPYADEDI